MKIFRISFIGTILIGVLLTTILLMKQKTSTPYTATLSPLFQELGKPIKSIDRVVSSILPIDEIDEKSLGEELKSQIESSYPQSDQESTYYLNALVKELTKDSKKPFEYKAYLVPGPPNACALPGGIICITDGLINSLKTEGELVAILGHEIGHIEKGHCFDLHRAEMLRKKMEFLSIATYAAQVFQGAAHLVFSKSQENESDIYGFQLLIKHGYSPFSLASAFQGLIELHHTQTSPNLIDDFFSSHPHLEIRKEQFQGAALRWQCRHPNVKTYAGAKNLKQKVPRQRCEFPDEYIRA